MKYFNKNTSCITSFIEIKWNFKSVALFFIASIFSKCFRPFNAAEINVENLDALYGRVKHVSLIFRHGERGPLFSFPTDPYRNYTWTHGDLKQLTDCGKRRLVALGKWFRLRYDHLVSKTYRVKEILVQSSRIDRTIMSAQCFLYGFYPANKSSSWYENEIWQPIPVHSLSMGFDNLIASRSRPCARRVQIYREEMAEWAAHYERVCRQYEQVINYISNHSGINFANMTKDDLLFQLFRIEDAFIVFQHHNLELPEWAKTIYPQPLDTILSKTLRNTNYSTKNLRLVAGPLLRSIIKDMRAKMNEKKGTFEESIGVHIYSGHDATIDNAMKALRVYEGLIPPYGSTLMFELRFNGTQFIVNVLYRNETEKEPYLLDVPGCGKACTLIQFESTLNPFLPKHWVEECKPSSSSTPSIHFNILFLAAWLHVDLIGL